ncbi:hypothetical protein GJ629_11280 [Halapricum sp. CBA1109]|uniref:hypothetical protein n=1 Tax=Halapricum sp. CBA1109 TaxID=2668068 RepID=UPI0012F9E86E|nr:hypothetical protein [Halapricum sp. CBA1109]MUV90414.1 hypothetical protein [Halapricum sp. CBA1109]
MLKLVRKGEAPGGTYRAMLLVGQTVRGATKELRRLVTSNGHLWNKTSKTRVEVYDDVTSGELKTETPIRTITGLKDTRWDYDTGEESTFEMDGAVESEEESGPTEQQQAIRTVVRAVALNDLSNRDAASLVDYGKTWVGDRVNEWRQGEHTELVGISPSDIDD